jgi:hypothetical protein
MGGYWCRRLLMQCVNRTQNGAPPLLHPTNAAGQNTATTVSMSLVGFSRMPSLNQKGNREQAGPRY